MRWLNTGLEFATPWNWVCARAGLTLPVLCRAVERGVGDFGKVKAVVNALLNTPSLGHLSRAVSNSGLGWETGQAYIKGLCVIRRGFS